MNKNDVVILSIAAMVGIAISSGYYLTRETYAEPEEAKISFKAEQRERAMQYRRINNALGLPKDTVHYHLRRQ